MPPILCLPGAWKGAWSWGVKLSTAAVPRHLSRCKFGHISSFPHSYSDEFMSFTLPWSFLSRHQSPALLASRARLCWRPKCNEWEGRPNCAINRPWRLWNLPPRAHEKKNDNLQQQRQQKATQTLVVQNMDSAILGELNHHSEDKY